MINRWDRTKQQMRQSCFELMPSGKTEAVWHYKFGHVPLTTISLPIAQTYEHFLCAYIAAYCEVTCVSNMFRWGNTCKPEQHHMYSAAGTLYETLWQHDSVWPPKVQRKYLPRPDIFLLWEHWKYNQPLWLLRSLKISCKDNLEKVASCSILSVFGTSKLQCLPDILEREGILF